MTGSTSTKRLDLLAAFFRNGIPFNRFLGVEVEQLGIGSCILRLPWRDELIGDPTRPSVHGGVTSMLADTAGGAACFTQLESHEDRVSTVDLRVDYLRPGGGADIYCSAEVVRMGNRVAVARSKVYIGSLPDPGSPDEPIATATGVYNVVRR